MGEYTSVNVEKVVRSQLYHRVSPKNRLLPSKTRVFGQKLDFFHLFFLDGKSMAHGWVM